MKAKPANVTDIKSDSTPAHEAFVNRFRADYQRYQQIGAARKAAQPEAEGEMSTSNKGTKEVFEYAPLKTESKEDSAVIARVRAIVQAERRYGVRFTELMLSAYGAGVDSVATQSAKSA